MAELKVKGVKAFLAKQLPEAHACFTKALCAEVESSPDWELYSHRAMTSLLLDDPHLAAWDAQQAIAIKPDALKAHFRLGRAFLQLGSMNLSEGYVSSAKTAFGLAAKSFGYCADNDDVHGDQALSMVEYTQTQLLLCTEDRLKAQDAAQRLSWVMYRQPTTEPLPCKPSRGDGSLVDENGNDKPAEGCACACGYLSRVSGGGCADRVTVRAVRTAAGVERGLVAKRAYAPGDTLYLESPLVSASLRVRK